MTNLYFAYTIKQDYESPLPPPEPRERKRKSRACDACSVRKTKCDDTRPCRHCINNNLECTELRQRKKLGPKNLRQKTIASINSIKDDDGEAKKDGSRDDLRPVADLFSSLDLKMVHAMAPLTVPLFTLCLPDVISYLPEFIGPPAADVSSRARKLAILTYALVLIEVMSCLDEYKHAADLQPLVQKHAARAHAECSEMLLSTLPGPVHYYLALVEIHVCSFLMLRGSHNSQKLVHLRAAITHSQLLDRDADAVGAAELRRCLFVLERLAYLFSDPVFRDLGVMLPQLPPEPSLDVAEVRGEMIRVLDSHGIFELPFPEPFTWQFSAECGTLYRSIEQQLPEATGFAQLIKVLLLFKVLTAVGIDDLDSCTQELLSLLMNATVVLASQDPTIRVHMAALALVPCLLELLHGCLVTVKQDASTLDALLQFSTCLAAYMPVCREADELLQNPVLGNWFSGVVAPNFVDWGVTKQTH